MIHKALLRLQMRKMLRALPVTLRQYAAQMIVDSLTAILSRVQPKILGIYVPLDYELDLHVLLDCLDPALELAVPVLAEGADRLSFAHWSRAWPLERPPNQSWSMPVPPHRLCIPDVLLVPCLAVGPEGYRLGQGKGWYDRTLSHPDYHHSIAVAVGYGCQRLAYMPYAAHDQRVAGWVSEQGLEAFDGRLGV